jgi:hypothetical protein
MRYYVRDTSKTREADKREEVRYKSGGFGCENLILRGSDDGTTCNCNTLCNQCTCCTECMDVLL